MHPPLAALLGGALLIAAPPAEAQDRDPGFTWSITPYLWASRTTLDLTFRDESLGGDTISFGDLLDDLDASFMVNVEGGRGHWSGFADLTWIETSAVEQRPMFLVDSNAETTVLDAGVAWWPGGVGSALSVLGGVRYHAFDNRYRFLLDGDEAGQVRDDTDYLDALLGLRYIVDFNERWSLVTRGDVSFGDSEGTWQLRASVTRTVGKRGLNQLVFGYQFKEAEFVDGDLRTEYAWHGPTAGFSFRF